MSAPALISTLVGDMTVLRLNVSFSKKVPGSSEYTSDGFLCALESEVSDSALNNPSELRQRMLFLWNEAKKSVEEQIAGNGNTRVAQTAPPATPAAPDPQPSMKNGAEPATSRQIKFLIGLSQRDHDMKISDLRDYLRTKVGNDDPHKLNKAQASEAIQGLT